MAAGPNACPPVDTAPQAALPQLGGIAAWKQLGAEGQVACDMVEDARKEP